MVTPLSVHWASVYPRERQTLATPRTSLPPRKVTSRCRGRESLAWHWRVLPCRLCERASDWPLRTCNIVLHVSATPIGYAGPAMHQAAALDVNVIVINTWKFKSGRTFLAPPFRSFFFFFFFTGVVSRFGFLNRSRMRRDRFSLARL